MCCVLFDGDAYSMQQARAKIIRDEGTDLSYLFELHGTGGRIFSNYSMLNFISYSFRNCTGT
jgi:hypothetical protein